MSVKPRVDWFKLTHSFGLKPTVVNNIISFRKRYDDSKLKLAALKDQSSTVDFSHYRSVLKNGAIVDELEKAYKDFKPVTYDVSKQISLIEEFQEKAVANAQATKEKVDAELKYLEATLADIESSRGFEDLKMSDIHKAAPLIEKKVEEMSKAGHYYPPGYKEKFGDLSIV